jgi:hypothetical protein
VKACNLYRNIEARETIEKYVSLMSKFNVYLNVVVKKKYSNVMKQNILEMHDGKINRKEIVMNK